MYWVIVLVAKANANLLDMWNCIRVVFCFNMAIQNSLYDYCLLFEIQFLYKSYTHQLWLIWMCFISD